MKRKPELLNHFGLSGGKDSTALMLWAIHESGYDPDSLLFTWCDTGNESEYTVNYIRWLAVKLNHRIKTIQPKLGFYDLAKKKGRFPSTRARFCTQELKIFPTQVYIATLTAQGIDVRLHTGVRAAESADRALLAPSEWDTLYDCEMIRPILSWQLENVWEIHERFGVPPNPMYGLTKTLPWNGAPNPFYGNGVMRVGCDPCVMSRKEEIRHMAVHRPERINFLAGKEFRTGRAGNRNHGFSSFFSRTKVPVSQRTKEIETISGEKMMVPTVHDVARWSQTSRGGLQYVLNLPLVTELVDEAPTCASRYGMCE